METPGKKYRYIEWLSAEEMHEAGSQWMSELQFARDEQLFLNDLVRSYTLQLIDKNVFGESKRIIDAISKAEKEIVALMKSVQSHQNLLEIMVNDVDELKMEKAYIETHWELTHRMVKYMDTYRKLKTQLFELVAKLMKKNKRLLT